MSSNPNLDSDMQIAINFPPDGLLCFQSHNFFITNRMLIERRQISESGLPC